ncbi:MAG: hypothetical protein K9M08_10505 [Pirellula sp.]|nr:hypothetical protein [Pirellula sp.]
MITARLACWATVLIADGRGSISIYGYVASGFSFRTTSVTSAGCYRLTMRAILVIEATALPVDMS